MARFMKQETLGVVSLKVNFDSGVSLWMAIKLRIAGKNYEPIAREVGKAIAWKIRQEGKDKT
jgi:hypothetical protein